MEHHPRGPSSLDRIKDCPGSIGLCKDLPEIPSKYAEEGTKLHDMVHPDVDISGLKPEQQQTIERCRERLQSYIAGAREDNVFYEKRLELKDLFGEVISFGTTDLLVLYPGQNTATIVDWKFGYNDVPPPHANVQLQAYAVMAAQEYGLTSVTCIVFCPRQFAEKRFEFEGQDLEQAANNVRYVVELPDKDETLRINDHCKYCKAQLICPEKKKEMERLVMYEKLEAMSTTDLGDQYSKWKMVEGIMRNVKAEIERRIQAGEEFSEWELKEVKGQRKITDINEAFAQSLEFFDEQAFRKLCSIQLGAFKDDWVHKYRQMHGGTIKDATARFYEVMPIERGDAKVQLTKKKTK